MRSAAKKGDFVAGAGGGGTLVYSAQHLIPDENFKHIVLYAIPGISMVGVGLYQRASIILLDLYNYYLSERQRLRLLKQAERDVEACRRQMQIIDNDANATLEHKKDMRAYLEKLEKLYFELQIKGAVTIK
jgi:hypothetical protein